MSGDARLLLRASAREMKAIAENHARDVQRHSGDMRTLEQMREAFRAGAYPQVVQLAATLTLPERMTATQRKVVEVARAKLIRG